MYVGLCITYRPTYIHVCMCVCMYVCMYVLHSGKKNILPGDAMTLCVRAVLAVGWCLSVTRVELVLYRGQPCTPS